MSFLAYEFMANPDIQDRVFNEIQEMEEELDGKMISYEQIQGLKYLDQCVSEVMRRWTFNPIADRTCVEDFHLDYEGIKLTIEKGTMINIPIAGYHQDSKYFPNPEKFDPERFSPENRRNIDLDAYLPFGIGPHNCIGCRFALMEVKTFFYYLLMTFKLEPNEKSQIPLKLKKTPIGVQSEKGIWISLKPRE